MDPAAVGVIHDLGNLVIEGGEDVRAGLEIARPGQVIARPGQVTPKAGSGGRVLPERDVLLAQQSRERRMRRGEQLRSAETAGRVGLRKVRLQ